MRRSFGSVTFTSLPHCRQRNVRLTDWDFTLLALECFQYSRSQWDEQNFVRLSAALLTLTTSPQRRQRNVRSIFPLAGRDAWMFGRCR